MSIISKLKDQPTISTMKNFTRMDLTAIKTLFFSTTCAPIFPSKETHLRLVFNTHGHRLNVLCGHLRGSSRGTGSHQDCWIHLRHPFQRIPALCCEMASFLEAGRIAFSLGSQMAGSGSDHFISQDSQGPDLIT